MTGAASPQLHILLATSDGAAHLGAQLASLAALDDRNWTLWVSDDGSQDATRDLVADFAARHPGRLGGLFSGPGRGAAANYLSLLLRPELPGGWIAFCDQDDIWMPGRITRARAAGADVYASRTILMAEDGRSLGPSALLRRGPSFANALVQNILAGNTLVLSPLAAEVLKRMSRAALAADAIPPFHDWWSYLALSGAGLRVVNDPVPGVFYRQHRGNLLGAHRGPRAMLARGQWLLSGRFGQWIGQNLTALEAAAEDLTGQNLALARRLGDLRRQPGPAAARGLFTAGLHRQSRGGDAVLALLALTGRL